MLGGMSAHYEIVFSLFLRDDTPDEVLAELRWQLGLAAGRPELWALGYQTPVLAPGEPSRLPGGESAALSRQYLSTLAGVDRYAWGLHVRVLWLDDVWGEVWWQVATWLSRYAAGDGYAGFYRESDAHEPTLFVVREGQPYLCEFGGQPRAFTS
jgi:hypothetical protein